MTTDLDLPLLPSSEQIRRREFASVRRGYDPDQVREFLFQVAEQVKTLESDLAEAKLQAEAGAAAIAASGPEGQAADDPYERVAQRFKEVIASADQEAEKIAGESREQAEAMLAEARSEADRIKVDAQAHAEEARQKGAEFLARAKGESDRALSGLASRRRDLARQIEDMHGRLLAAAKNLEFALSDEPVSGRRTVEAAPADRDVIEDEPSTVEAIEASPVERDPDADHIDRYEDMLGDEIELDADLPSLELDFDDEDAPPSSDAAG